MSIGSGRVILQDILRINEAFSKGKVDTNKHIKNIKKYLKEFTWLEFYLMGSAWTRRSFI